MKTLTAYYDLAIAPVSFDVIPFLIRARMAADASDCDRLHVVIVPAGERGVDGMFRDKTALYGAAEMHWRLWNLVIPACRLIGASVTLATGWDQARLLRADDVYPADGDRQGLSGERSYFVRPIVEYARTNGRRVVPVLHASEHAMRVVRERYRRYPKPVATITARNTYDPSRNVPDETLLAIADNLSAKYTPIVIYDTADELRNGSGYGGLNLDLRMACYEKAALNVVGNCGPSMLLWFGEAPWIEFDAARPAADWHQFWKAHHGLDPIRGDQLPWAREDQRLEYRPASEIDFVGLAYRLGAALAM